MLLRKKEEIEVWLNQYDIKKYYELIEDEEYGYVVNVNGPVYLYSKKLKSIDVKFNIVKEDFTCSNNELESLESCPEIVRDFNCGENKLKTLKGSPKIVNGFFNCSNNKLESLEGSPEVVKGNFYCDNNDLNSLKYMTEIVKGVFWCKNNNLSFEGLKYLPKKVNSNEIDISNNKELKEFQAINNFQELKNKLNVYFEKENLLKIINKEELNLNTKNTINKI